MKNHIFILFVVVVLIAAVLTGLYFYKNKSTTVINNFSYEGNAVQNNPGMKQGVWYLVYEVPGSPALTAELRFTSLSKPKMKSGDRVYIEGSLLNGVVTVTKIDVINTQSETLIKLYFYNPNLDLGQGGPQCTRNGLVAVDRIIPKTQTPLRDSINLLLRGEISPEEKREGITTEFPLPGVTLVNADIKNGVATLTFDDPQSKTSGGSCRSRILWYQIEATARQFPNIESVIFKPDTLFQP